MTVLQTRMSVTDPYDCVTDPYDCATDPYDGYRPV